MNKITVEVTDAQAEYINALNNQLPGTTPGNLLLALAFSNLQLDAGFSSEDNAVEIITAALRAFAVDGKLPTKAADDLFIYGVNSRPVTSFSPSRVELGEV